MLNFSKEVVPRIARYKIRQPIIAKGEYVTKGPHLYVSLFLYQYGVSSPKRIWAYYLKDKEAYDSQIFTSFNHLKREILPHMLVAGKVVKGRAVDIPKYKRSGYGVNINKAFKNTHPKILIELEPIPQFTDKDPYKKYFEKIEKGKIEDDDFYEKAKLKFNFSEISDTITNTKSQLENPENIAPTI